jgi:DnaJ-domain-containing protein 1
VLLDLALGLASRQARDVNLFTAPVQESSRRVPMRSVMSSDALVFVIVMASLVASLASFPVLLAAYAFCLGRMRKAGPNFSLGKLETIELNRAVLLYERVCEQLQDPRKFRALRGGFLTRQFKQQVSENERDLEAYAVHLKATIVQLRAKPIQRFRAWLHLASSRTAFSCCLLLYGLLFCSLLAVFDGWHHLAWVREMRLGLDDLVTWRPFGDPPLYASWLAANWFAANVAPLALPILYCIQRAKLRSRHRLTRRDLEAFAEADPDNLIQFNWCEDSDNDASGSAQEPPAPTGASEETSFEVLRVSRSATIEEIRTAYKLLIKQNHPDRVHDMAPLFREIAEKETKRINAAYEEALSWARSNAPPQ